MNKPNWLGSGILFLGLGLIVFPFVFAPPFMLGYDDPDPAAWNSYIAGAVLTTLELSFFADYRKYAKWVNLALALWLIVAPFALRFFATDPVAAYSQFAVGVLVGAEAIRSLVRARTANSEPRDIEFR